MVNGLTEHLEFSCLWLQKHGCDYDMMVTVAHMNAAYFDHLPHYQVFEKSNFTISLWKPKCCFASLLQPSTLSSLFLSPFWSHTKALIGMLELTLATRCPCGSIQWLCSLCMEFFTDTGSISFISGLNFRTFCLSILDPLNYPTF